MIRRLYVHNFRCLENFELKLEGMPSVLLIGKNGSGKSTVGDALQILQQIGRGTSYVRALAKPADFARGRADVPMRFEVEVVLGPQVHVYTLALRLPDGEENLRVLEETYAVDGLPVFTRGEASKEQDLYQLENDVVALPLLQAPFSSPLFSFRQHWLARMRILRPPLLIRADYQEGDQTLWPDSRGSNLAAWISEVLAQTPAAYARMDAYLRQVMPDFKAFRLPATGPSAKGLVVEFAADQGSLTLPLGDLSDGERCFFLCAALLASNAGWPAVCFWDEPDNYLALDEVQHFIVALRSQFQKNGGQFIATSHNPEVIRAFSDETTLVLQRKSHLEPTVVRKLSDLRVNGDLVDAITRGDLGE